MQLSRFITMEVKIKQIFQADRKFFRVTDCLIGINYCMFNFDALCRKFPVTKNVLPLCQFIDSSTPFSRGRPLGVLFAFLGPSTLFIGSLILTGDPINKTPTRRVAPGQST